MRKHVVNACDSSVDAMSNAIPDIVDPKLDPKVDPMSRLLPQSMIRSAPRKE